MLTPLCTMLVPVATTPLQKKWLKCTNWTPMQSTRYSCQLVQLHTAWTESDTITYWSLNWHEDTSCTKYIFWEDLISVEKCQAKLSVSIMDPLSHYKVANLCFVPALDVPVQTDYKLQIYVLTVQTDIIAWMNLLLRKLVKCLWFSPINRYSEEGGKLVSFEHSINFTRVQDILIRNWSSATR